jgi:hypothetical protein
MRSCPSLSGEVFGIPPIDSATLWGRIYVEKVCNIQALAAAGQLEVDHCSFLLSSRGRGDLGFLGALERCHCADQLAFPGPPGFRAHGT